MSQAMKVLNIELQVVIRNWESLLLKLKLLDLNFLNSILKASQPIIRLISLI